MHIHIDINTNVHIYIYIDTQDFQPLLDTAGAPQSVHVLRKPQTFANHLPTDNPGIEAHAWRPRGVLENGTRPLPGLRVYGAEGISTFCPVSTPRATSDRVGCCLMVTWRTWAPKRRRGPKRSPERFPTRSPNLPPERSPKVTRHAHPASKKAPIPPKTYPHANHSCFRHLMF